jgi:pilus assembly protein Flp/PilA
MKTAPRTPVRAGQRGATAIEYGLIAALMTIVMLVGLGQFGNSAVSMYGNLTNRIVSAGR